MTTRILFLCARFSGRALLAASLVHAQDAARWEVWSTPPSGEQATLVVEQVLQEQGMALLSSDHLIIPAFGMRWDQGIVLCSGATET